jgi:Subtilase family
LDAAAALGELHGMRAAMSRARSGAITSQGDYAQNSDLVRSQNSLDGAGITVGVISDSYNCYQQYQDAGTPLPGGQQGYANNGFTATAATDISTGDIPSSVNVIEDATCQNYGAPTQLPFGDEGRAMMQIVHDVAPGAGLAFYTAENSEADFASGIAKLAAPASSGGGGAKIIVDDVGYFDEPFFQDGLVAQAVNNVVANGVAYFSSAGNNGSLAYDNNSPAFVTSASAPAGEVLLNFDQTGGTTTALPVTIASMIPGEFVAIVVEWDQPYVTGAPSSGGSKNQIDVCISGAGGDIITNLNGTAATCSGATLLGQDPVQVMIVANPANSAGNTAAENVTIQVGLVSTGPHPGRIKVVVEDDGAGSTINQFAPNGGATIQGHPLATGALAVGAAFFVSTPSCGFEPTLELFSSAGGDPILFDSTGKPQTAVTRQKPDVVGPDGGNDTFLGFTLASGGIDDPSTVTECANNDNYPNFFGTSAAAPHVASIAALLLQADPALTPTQLYTFLRSSATAIGATPTPSAPNFAAGYGFVQADMAAAMVPAIIPAAPTLTLTSSSIVTGGSTTITWSSANTTGCTASGAWTGPLSSSGSKPVAPTAVGTDTYTLTCTNAAGDSPPTSVTLTVTAAAPPPSGGGGGGGGSLQLTMLLGLLGLCVARVQRERRFMRSGL